MSNATIEVYEGYSDSVPYREPEWSETVEICSDWWGNSYPKTVPPEAETVLFAEDIEYHSPPLEIHCEADEPVTLCVHTCDSYHNPNEWGKPIERGLNFGPDMERGNPYGCEIWGRVLMWVAER